MHDTRVEHTETRSRFSSGLVASGRLWYIHNSEGGGHRGYAGPILVGEFQIPPTHLRLAKITISAVSGFTSCAFLSFVAFNLVRVLGFEVNCMIHYS